MPVDQLTICELYLEIIFIPFVLSNKHRNSYANTAVIICATCLSQLPYASSWLAA
jgi:hypothetical protein